MKVAPFDVVVVPFPYSDRLAKKRRPALIVSHTDLATRLKRVWVAMITSVAAGEHGDCPITDLGAAGLPAASILRASKLATIDTDQVLKVIGHLAETDQAMARRALIGCAGF